MCVREREDLLFRESGSIQPRPHASSPEAMGSSGVISTMPCFAGYPDQDSEPRVQVTSDDEKGLSRQVQALKTNQNETIRGEESLPQHDGPEALSWRAQVGPHVAGRSNGRIQPRRINPIKLKANRQGGPDDERRLPKGGRRDIARFAFALALILLVHPSSSSLSTTTSPELSKADANAGQHACRHAGRHAGYNTNDWILFLWSIVVISCLCFRSATSHSVQNTSKTPFFDPKYTLLTHKK